MSQVKTILYIDDDEDDVDLLLGAFKHLDNTIDIIIAKNGVEALERLHELKQDPPQLPNLIILDLNLPLVDGIEIFNRIKKDIALQVIPIVVFTSTSNPNDKALFESLGIEMITKPNNFTQMHEIVSRFISTCV